MNSYKLTSSSATGVHPQNCNPSNMILLTTPYSYGLGLPSTCPGSKPGRSCLVTSADPSDFAEFCITKKTDLVDAISMAPAWLYNLEGDKIGTRARPWCLSDYVVALVLRNNPNAVQERLREADMSSVLPSKKSQYCEDEELETKKRNIDIVKGKPWNDKRKHPRTVFSKTKS